MDKLSLQERYAPHSACFGCGPKNSQGLHVRSFAQGEWVIAEFTPEKHHEAFNGIVNGGIVGAILDCHANWTAAYTLMQKNNLLAPPCTVTARFSIKLLKPTPSSERLILKARPIEVREKSVLVEAFIELVNAPSVQTVEFEGLFMAVPPTHPAYARW